MRNGDRVPTWFSGESDGRSTVLAVLPYHGRYPEMFDCVLRLSAPNTRRGWIEQAWKLEDRIAEVIHERDR